MYPSRRRCPSSPDHVTVITRRHAERLSEARLVLLPRPLGGLCLGSPPKRGGSPSLLLGVLTDHLLARRLERRLKCPAGLVGLVCRGHAAARRRLGRLGWNNHRLWLSGLLPNGVLPLDSDGRDWGRGRGGRADVGCQRLEAELGGWGHVLARTERQVSKQSAGREGE
eukprot:scaffold16912_cov112-Isochrysis_galbana.AAC.9